MIPIIRNEFFHTFKSFKSIAIVLFFTLTSFLTATYLANHPELLGDVGNDSAYTSSIKFLIFFLGFLFVFAVSHDIINREIDYQTIRLLVSKTSRFNIIAGKFIGSFLFWVYSTSISFLIVSLYAKSWFFLDYLTVITVLFFITCFNVLLSTVLTRPSMTMFAGILLGILCPVLGFWAAFSNNWYLLPFKYLLPYYYVVESGRYLVVPFLLGLLFLTASYFMFTRRDL
ncbi:ABC transporter permease [Exiguobacterium oxidotolerans]|uniref:ABC transporter permease n=1 Tax=Exiguobacterium oxidotolerans TaxID=223958 RepID=A0A653IHD4_9BACL|nr:ABC transporter permease subunit [Exiguobacterium oxidotolerans]VWX38640.1 conserved membrane hypothetical protein [Exiguobacterium oxidotolerans]